MRRSYARPARRCSASWRRCRKGRAVADLSQNPFALLSLIAAPAVLTNSASVLVMSTTNRFLRASERMRALAVRVEEKKLTPGLRALVRTQVDRTERQA